MAAKDDRTSGSMSKVQDCKMGPGKRRMKAQDIIDEVGKDQKNVNIDVNDEVTEASVSFDAICQKCETIEDLKKLKEDYKKLNKKNGNIRKR